MASSERIVEFDILKGIGILLVVLGHTGISGLPYQYIYSFHLPLFFFVSGFFFKKESVTVTFRKRVRSLLIPWLFFSLLFSILDVILGWISTNDISISLKEYFCRFNPFDEGCWVLYKTIWFLICLFGVSLICAILNTCIRNIYVGGAIILIAFMVAYLLQVCDINLPFFIDSMLGTLIYYYAGEAFKRSELYIKDISIFVSVAFILLLSCIIVLVRPDVDLSRNRFPVYLPFISIPYTVFLFYFIKGVYKMFGEKWLYPLIVAGMDSLLILGFHRFFFVMINGFNFSFAGLATCFIKFALAMVFVWIIKKPVIKYIPFCVGR